MATLDRRVQVLFDEDLYARLLAEAEAERMSVGALIRRAVEGELRQRRRLTRREALEALFRSGEEHPQPDEDWEAIKDDSLDRPILMEVE
ncbi:MAG: ribbon-helix-helix protein, CopG family [Microbacterium sp.]